MKARVRLLLFGASAVLLLLVGLAGYALFTWDERPALHLRDGSVVHVETVRYGQGGLFQFGPTWKRRLASLAPHLPLSLASRVTAPAIDLGPVMAKGALAVSLSHEGKPNAAMPVCTLRDSHGCRYLPVDNYPSNESGENGNVSFFPFFPRREPAFQVEALCPPWSPKQVGSVTVPCPIPTRYPTWKAEPLPVTRRSGPLAVTLTEVSTGWSREGLDPHLPAEEGKATFTRLAFHTAPASGGWELVGASLADAMGGSYRFGQESWLKEPSTLYVAGDNLCRQEPACRYELEFNRARTPNARPDRVYRFRGVPVPVVSSGQPFTYLTLPDGRRFTLAAFEWKHGQPLQGNWQPHADEIGRLWAYDTRGRLLGTSFPSLPGGSPRSQMLDLKVPKGTKQIELRLGVYTSRFVRFTVKPRWITP